MCLSEAGRVLSLDEGEAVTVGDWVLVHTGLAVDLLDETTATELTAFSRLARGVSEETDP